MAYSCLRLCSRRLVNQALLSEKCSTLQFIRPVTLKAQPAQPPVQQGHDERNMKLQRPMSPHLTIYAPQLSSMLSINHRFSGLALTGYLMCIGYGALILPESIPHYIDALADAKVGVPTIFTMKFLLALPMTYHFFNGIRHLAWDMGKFLTLKEVYATGYAMLALAFGSAIALSAMYLLICDTATDTAVKVIRMDF